MTEWEQEQKTAESGSGQDYEQSVPKEDTKDSSMNGQLSGPVTTHTNPTTTKPTDDDD